MNAPCPFCGLTDGFHDEDVHAAIVVPAHLRRPTHSDIRVSAAQRCRNPRCEQPFDSPGAGGCRNPRHQA